MDAKDLKESFVVYISIIMPALLILMAIFSGANFLWFLLLFTWFGAFFLIVMIPDTPDLNNQ